MWKLLVALLAALATGSGETAPATLRIEYTLPEQGPTRMGIAWSTRSASGQLTRELSEADLAELDKFQRAAATPGSDWQTPSKRAAELLLDGIGPLDRVRRVVIAVRGAYWLQKLPFDALGNPPLIERFAVSYEAQPGGADGLLLLWELPPGKEAEFIAAHRRQVSLGLEPAEALRQAKLEWRGAGGDRAHPAQWAALEWYAGPEAPQSGMTAAFRWAIWSVGIGMLAGGLAFAIWWRRERLELW